MLPLDKTTLNSSSSSSNDSICTLMIKKHLVPKPESGVGGSDSDIDALIANFIDQPNPQLPSIGSTANGNGRDSLKRGIDNDNDNDNGNGNGNDNDNAVSIKRGRFNNVTDHDNDGHDAQNPIPLSQDQSHDGHDNGEERRNRHVLEFDFLLNALREADSGLNQNSDNEANADMEFQDDDESYRFSYYDWRRTRIMERFRVIAKESAVHFARFDSDFGNEGTSLFLTPPHGIDDSDTPFSITVKAIKDRTTKRGYQGCGIWVPKRDNRHGEGEKRFLVPSLQELCLKVLADNADAIVSLECVPDELRHKLCKLLCDSRKMNSRFFQLLLTGAPTEIRLSDCSWLTDEQFIKSFEMCDTSRLEVLQLDQCGRCIPDYALIGNLRQTPRWLPRLTSLSISGACRLSDKGLYVLVSSAPVLRSINLSQCSLLSSASLDILADSLGSLLKELYLDDCHLINAAQIVPALKKLEHLEVLSLAGIETVSDEFIKDYITARGHNMKELVLKDCRKLTDASVKVIAECCPRLCALDLMYLQNLTDLSIGYLTNSCRALHTLKLCRNPFSDEAIAAFLEINGESMKELSLNNIKKVGQHTTLSLARHAKSLHTLDLSWCRNLTDNELGLIVDSCFSLRLLKLFGCSMVTDVFLNGHSNPEIQILGLKMSALLQNVNVPDPYQGSLRYSSVSVDLM